MKKQTIAILLAGLVAMGGAVWFRQYYAKKRTMLQIALSDPKVQKFQANITELDNQIAANPNDLKSRWKLADIYQKIGMLDKALPQLQEIQKRDPKSLDAAMAVSATHLALQQPVQAEAAYKQVTVQWPKLAAGWQGLAAALYHEGRYLESITIIRTAITLEPQNPNNHFILGNTLIQYVNQFPNSENYAQYAYAARQEFEKLLSIWPEKGDIENRIGNACTLMHDQKGAQDHYKKALALLPNRVDIYVSLAQVYIAAGKPAEARKVAEDAFNRKLRDPSLYDLYGRVLQSSSEQGVLDRTLKAFGKAVELSPKNPYYQERYGSALVRANRLPEARAAFETAVQLNPNRAFPYQQLSAIYTRMNETARATAAAKMATQMVFNDQQLRQIQLLSKNEPGNLNLHLILADRYKDLGMFTAARDKYVMVQKLDPKNQRAKVGLEALDTLRNTRMAQGNQDETTQ